MSVPMARHKILTTMALLVGGWASRSAAFSVPDGSSRWKRRANLRSLDRRTTPPNLPLPSSPLGSISRGSRKETRYPTTTRRNMAGGNQPPQMADLAVRLDSPILSPNKASSALWKPITLGGLVTQTYKTALITLAIALAIVLATRLSSTLIDRAKPLLQSLSHGYRVSRGRVLRVLDKRRRGRGVGVGTPMDFTDEATEGWGVCTLASREEVGRSRFVRYGFDLPREDHTLDLLTGQQLTLCYLDRRDNAAKGDYYPYSPKAQKGSFSILVPRDKRVYAEDEEITPDFTELTVGDEIALKPGPETFQYRGQYLPVTDLLHIVAGEGIAPVLNQVKSVLPSGSSSLKLIKVVWMNKSEKDFDIGQSTLEEDYYKYFKKLAVSCIVEDFEKDDLWDNAETVANIPRFNPGTMVVVSGPRSFVGKSKDFLIEMGYPDECICVFPSD